MSNCIICLEVIQNLATPNQCNHQYCYFCLCEWSKQKQTCPLCRKVYQSVIYNFTENGNREILVSNIKETPPDPEFLSNTWFEQRDEQYRVIYERLVHENYGLHLVNDRHPLDPGFGFQYTSAAAREVERSSHNYDWSEVPSDPPTNPSVSCQTEVSFQQIADKSSRIKQILTSIRNESIFRKRLVAQIQKEIQIVPGKTLDKAIPQRQKRKLSPSLLPPHIQQSEETPSSTLLLNPFHKSSRTRHAPIVTNIDLCSDEEEIIDNELRRSFPLPHSISAGSNEKTNLINASFDINPPEQRQDQSTDLTSIINDKATFETLSEFHAANQLLRIVGTKTSFNCRFHGFKTFSSYHSLRTHAKKFHVPSACVKCSKCSNLFANLSSLKLHMLSHKKRIDISVRLEN